MESLEEQGQNVSALDARPELNALQTFYYEAFIFLSPMRNSGMGVCAIPINHYIEFYNIFDAPNELDFFAKVIREIDGLYLNEKYEESLKKK